MSPASAGKTYRRRMAHRRGELRGARPLSQHGRRNGPALGGVKDSGIGREGPRYSIRDMTEERMVLFNY
jgi:hypothetical protein